MYVTKTECDWIFLMILIISNVSVPLSAMTMIHDYDVVCSGVVVVVLVACTCSSCNNNRTQAELIIII